MAPRHDPIMCSKGHLRTASNTNVDKLGHVRCTDCRKDRERRHFIWSMRPEITPELKARAVELRRQGLTCREVALELGCGRSVVSKWAREAERGAQ